MNLRRLTYASIAIVAYVVLTWAIWRSFTQFGFGGVDLVPFWLGGRALVFEQISPYAAIVTQRSQQMILGGAAVAGADQLAFAYPLPALFLVLPLAWLPFDLAQAAWLSLSLIITVVAVAAFMGTRRPATFAVVCAIAILFYPDARTLMLGQYAVVSASALMLALWASEHRLPVVGGAMLAVACLKPQMSFLLVPALLIHAFRARHFATPAAAAVAGILLIGASLAWWPAWPTEWLERLTEYRSYTPQPSPVRLLAGDLAPGITAACLLLAVVVALRLGDLREMVAWEVVLTLLAAPGTSMSDQMLLLLPLCMVLRELPLLAQAALAVAAIAGPWLWFGISETGGREAAVMIVALPLILLGVLIIRVAGRLSTLPSA